MTVDWEGNAWFANSVSTGKDNNALLQTIATGDETFTIKGNYDRANNTEGINFLIEKGIGTSDSNTNGVIVSSLADGKTSTNLGGKGRSYGKRSFVEGSSNVAYGINSHAVGNYNISIGDTSYTEGAVNVAEGAYSHAGGFGNYAKGNSSYAHGTGNIAEGYGAQALGAKTEANGYWSYSNGVETIAEGNIQTVIGAANKIDSSKAFIIGNGKLTKEKDDTTINSSNSEIIHLNNENADETAINRSNAMTVDWDGNMELAGGIIMTSPNGTKFKITINDNGILQPTKLS
jgi:hypothetical protein